MNAVYNISADDARACENLALRIACNRGDIDSAQWLSVTFGLLEGAHACVDSILRKACIRGHLNISVWLLSRVGGPRLRVILGAWGSNMERKSQPGCICDPASRCIQSDAQVLEIIVRQVPDLSLSISRAILKNIHGGNLTTIQMLVNHAQLNSKTQDETLVRRLVFGACVLGNIDVANWLVIHFGLGGSRILGGDTTLGVRILVAACRLGDAVRGNPKLNMYLAQWATDTFALSASDIQACDYSILRIACRRGNIRTVQWLITCFKLTASDMCTSNYGPLWSPLADACKFGNTITVRWIVRYLNISHQHILDGEGYSSIINVAWEDGSFELVRWFAEYFSFGLDAIFYASCHCFEPRQNRRAMHAWLTAARLK